MARTGSSAAWTPMLSIGKLAAGQADYYLDQAGKRVAHVISVSSGVEDYYFASYAPEGRWTGSAAAALGLAGAVRDEELRAVLDGSSVGMTSSARRVPGFDVTFSAPKGVSVLFGLGPSPLQELVVRAHETAVDDAFAYLERHAAFGRRGSGGCQAVEGGGLIAAAFRHGTSRAADPQLHTHVLVANLVRGPDGRWGALDGRRLFAHAKTAGYLYEARLRYELTRELGLEWTAVSKGIAEPAGTPHRVLKAFSRRRAEVERALEEKGREGASAARIATLETRRRKREVDPATLAEEWASRARELGFGVPEIAALMHVCGQRAVDDIAADLEAHLLGPEGLTRDRSTFSRRDAIQAWCESLPADVAVTSAVVEAQVDRLLGSSAVVPLHPTRLDTVLRRRDGRVVPALPREPLYTTAELLAIEQRVIALAAEEASAPTATAEATQTAVDARPSLAVEQRAMVHSLTQSPARVSVVIGKAGTGKTFALDAARAAWEASGVRVLGAAVARRAARELEEGAGIRSTSVTALLHEMRTGRARAALRNAVVVVDEASLVPTRDLAVLLEHVSAAEGKVALVGDDRQLPSIRAGGAFHALATSTGALELRENRRQTAAWERSALDLLRHGEAVAALDLYREHGRLVVGSNASVIREALVADWWAAGDVDGALMIAFRRADVADLNGRARALMAAAGSLGEESLPVGERKFSIGDRIILRRNDRWLQVANGERGTVVALDQRTLTVQLRDRRVELDERYLALPGALTHGYAVTGHVAQGMTTESAFVLGTVTLFREWGYVAMSRGRRHNRFYAVVGEPTDRDEIAPTQSPRPPLDELEAALTRSRAQRLALEQQGEPPPVVPLRRPATQPTDTQRRTRLARAAAALDPPGRAGHLRGWRSEPLEAERRRDRAGEGRELD